MWQRISNTLLGIFILCLMGLTLFYLAIHTAHLIASLDQPLIVAILAASATILAATITVVVGNCREKARNRGAFSPEEV